MDKHIFKQEKQAPAKDPSKLTKYKAKKKDKPPFLVMGCRYRTKSIWSYFDQPLKIGYAKTVSEAKNLVNKCKNQPYYKFDYAVIYYNNVFFDCFVFVLPNKKRT